jgi:hypothetical protein
VGSVRAKRQLSSVALRDHLAALVCERQALRDARASMPELEQNRLAIVTAQLELSQALVSEHIAPIQKSTVAA